MYETLCFCSDQNQNLPRQHFLSESCPLLAGLPPIFVFHFGASSFPEFEVSCLGGGGSDGEMLASLLPPTDWDVGVNCQRLSTLSETRSNCGIFLTKRTKSQHKWNLCFSSLYYYLLFISNFVRQSARKTREMAMCSVLAHCISPDNIGG